MLPLIAVLSAACMDVEPVSWRQGERRTHKKRNHFHFRANKPRSGDIGKGVDQEQSLLYLFTHLQLLRDGLVANGWLQGERERERKEGKKNIWEEFSKYLCSLAS